MLQLKKPMRSSAPWRKNEWRIFARYTAIMKAQEITRRLKALGNKEQAATSQRFFKTGPGEYGEGDVFLGIKVPVLRKLAKEFADLPLKEVKTLLNSGIHEERLLSLLILVRRFGQGDDLIRQEIYDIYLKNTSSVNNWDLVDLSAHCIVGPYLANKSRAPLYRLAQSESIWERRIAIMTTFHFIKNGEFPETLKISKLLLSDTEDLIHKAVGWMLREIGKRHLPAEERFLKKHYRQMPRTMLRYAIEKFPEPKRQAYLKGTI
jgi:3-methyladenine DNA glycosylase AlkD